MQAMHKSLMCKTVCTFFQLFFTVHLKVPWIHLRQSCENRKCAKISICRIHMVVLSVFTVEPLQMQLSCVTLNYSSPVIITEATLQLVLWWHDCVQARVCASVYACVQAPSVYVWICVCLYVCVNMHTQVYCEQEMEEQRRQWTVWAGMLKCWMQ